MPGPIHLYLIRHAIAEDRGEAWPDDRLRPLTKDGAERMKRQAAGLVELGVTFDEILTSPLVRTRQTADILADAYAGRPRIAELPALEPGRRPKDALTALSNFTKRGRLALVGHEPGLGEIASTLLGLRTPLNFKKGGAALIDVALLPPPAGSGELVWFVTPRILRGLVRRK